MIDGGEGEARVATAGVKRHGNGGPRTIWASVMPSWGQTHRSRPLTVIRGRCHKTSGGRRRNRGGEKCGNGEGKERKGKANATGVDPWSTLGRSWLGFGRGLGWGWGWGGVPG